MSNGIPVLMEVSAESVLPAYHEAFDPVGFEGLRPGSQGRRGGQRSVGSMLVVVLLVGTPSAGADSARTSAIVG